MGHMRTLAVALPRDDGRMPEDVGRVEGCESYEVACALDVLVRLQVMLNRRDHAFRAQGATSAVVVIQKTRQLPVSW